MHASYAFFGKGRFSLWKHVPALLPFDLRFGQPLPIIGRGQVENAPVRSKSSRRQPPYSAVPSPVTLRCQIEPSLAYFFYAFSNSPAVVGSVVLQRLGFQYMQCKGLKFVNNGRTSLLYMVIRGSLFQLSCFSFCPKPFKFGILVFESSLLCFE